jgi:hypothetical protein
MEVVLANNVVVLAHTALIAEYTQFVFLPVVRVYFGTVPVCVGTLLGHGLRESIRTIYY